MVQKVLQFAVGIIGLYMVIKGGQIKNALDRYEFEHRTDGGVVRFENFEAQNAHLQRRSSSQWMMKWGFIIFGVGALFFFMSEE